MMIMMTTTTVCPSVCLSYQQIFRDAPWGSMRRTLPPNKEADRHTGYKFCGQHRIIVSLTGLSCRRRTRATRCITPIVHVVYKIGFLFRLNADGRQSN